MNEVKEQEIERLKKVVQGKRRGIVEGELRKRMRNYRKEIVKLTSIKSLTCSKRKQLICTAGEVII